MIRPSSRRSVAVAVATLVALVAAVVAPLIAPCVAMAADAPAAPAMTACGHPATPAETPPADDAPRRDGTCCLSATLVPATPDAPVLTTSVAMRTAAVVVADPVATLAVGTVESPPPRPVGGVFFGVWRL